MLGGDEVRDEMGWRSGRLKRDEMKEIAEQRKWKDK